MKLEPGVGRMGSLEQRICERLFEAIDALSTIVSLLPGLRDCEECITTLEEELAKRCKEV